MTEPRKGSKPRPVILTKPVSFTVLRLLATLIQAKTARPSSSDNFLAKDSLISTKSRASHCTDADDRIALRTVDGFRFPATAIVGRIKPVPCRLEKIRCHLWMSYREDCRRECYLAEFSCAVASFPLVMDAVESILWSIRHQGPTAICTMSSTINSSKSKTTRRA